MGSYYIMDNLYLAVLLLAAVLITCLEARRLPANHIQDRDAELRDLSYQLWQKYHKRDVDTRQVQQQQQEQTGQVCYSTGAKISAKVIKIKNLILEIWDDYIVKIFNKEPQLKQMAPTIKMALTYVPDEHITYRVCVFSKATTVEELAEAMVVDERMVYSVLSMMNNYNTTISVEDDIVPLLEDFVKIGHDVHKAMQDAGVQDPGEGNHLIPTLGRYFKLQDVARLISEIRNTYDDTFRKMAEIASDFIFSYTVDKDWLINHYIFPEHLTDALVESNSLKKFASRLPLTREEAEQIDTILLLYATAPDEAIEIDNLLMDIIQLLVYHTELMDIIRSVDPY